MTGMKKALITGITGQDGAYLAELLLQKGYEVHGIKRRTSLINTQRVDHLYQDPHERNLRFILHYGDLTDSTNIIRIIQQVQPDEIYNLGAMSMCRFLSRSQNTWPTPMPSARSACWKQSASSASRKDAHLPGIHFRALWEGAGDATNRNDAFLSRARPYGVAKLYGYWITVNYREAYGMYACNGILFNHESPLRGETFVTRKITRAVAQLALGLTEKLYMGNIDAKRDWGHAKDYVEAMYLILQQDVAEDFVIATGVTTSVRDFIRMAFEKVGVEIEFKGKGVDEKGFVRSCTNEHKFKTGQEVVSIDPRYFRPTEVDLLIGDPSKAMNQLGWAPKYSLKELVAEMVEADLQSFNQEKVLIDSGFTISRQFE
jgi:GDPmannose 4,6-dehydratase